FGSVIRTGRPKPTRCRQPWRNHDFIQPKRLQNDCATLGHDSLASGKETNQLLSQLFEISLRRRTLGIDNKIKTRRNRYSRSSHDLADSPSDPVSVVRFSELSRCRQAKSTMIQTIAQRK